MALIEQAKPEDVDQVHRIAREVFAVYGDYGKLLPRFFASQGVTTYVARIGPEVVGFVMMGFMPWTGGGQEENPWIGDLLAMGVDPARQGKGIGTELIRQAFELVAQMSEWRDIRQVQLTCAESNQQGLGFFARNGFKVIDAQHGSYSSGQAAMRLGRDFP